jgi:ankyrin repeat protein
MPAKSKSTTSDSMADDDNLDDILAEFRARYARNSRRVGNKSSSSSGEVAPEENSLGELLNFTVGNTEVDRWLAENGMVSVDEADEEGETHLLTTAIEGDVRLVRWLVEAVKASVDKADNSGCTSLQIVIIFYEDPIEIVVWLIEKGSASVDQADNEGDTPLHSAVHKGDIEMVVCLVEQGKASIDQTNNNGDTPLIIAAWSGHTDIVQWLIKEGKADIDYANDNGWTALHNAAHMGHVEIVRLLIEEGNASLNEVTSTHVEKPLLISLRANVVNVDVPEFLLSAGARLRDEDLDHPVVFNSFVKGWIHKEVQKLEVHSRLSFVFMCWNSNSR